MELPDDLFRKAKIAAARQGSTLQNLLIQGLQHVLNEVPSKPNALDLPTLPTKGRVPYEMKNAQIEAILRKENADLSGRFR